MFAMITYRGREDTAGLPENVRIPVVSVPHGTGLRARMAAAAAAKKLRCAGVRQAVFPPDYPYADVFARRSIAVPPLAPLYCATAHAIVLCCMERMGLQPRRAEVMLAARQVSPELRSLAFRLCGEVRYVSLAVPWGGEELAQELRRSRGVAPRFRPDLIVSFDGTEAGENALTLDEELQVEYDSALPGRLLAALFASGMLRAEELRVRNICLREKH